MKFWIGQGDLPPPISQIKDTCSFFLWSIYGPDTIRQEFRVYGAKGRFKFLNSFGQLAETRRWTFLSVTHSKYLLELSNPLDQNNVVSH